MRKRKRGCGSYVDEDTGEVTTVQTTKQAKRNHQRSGKWYKEPTEQEIRAWDREEKRQTDAERTLRRDENKKINAAKRAEKDSQAQQLKRQLFEIGKITFTQTLAKKDEDQLNLHSWFGGCPQPPQSKKAVTKPGAEEGDKDEDRDKDGDRNKDRNALDRTVQSTSKHRQSKQLSQHSCVNGDSKHNMEEFFDLDTAINFKVGTKTMADLPQHKDRSAQELDPELNLLDSSQDFDIAEDSDAGTEILDQDPNQAEQDSYHTFKVPALPVAKRLPLSPLSQSDLNSRAIPTTQVSSFKDRLEKAQASMTGPSTQVVRDLLSGICTQDLADDLDEDSANDKENEEPEIAAKAEGSGSPVKSTSQPSTLKSIPSFKDLPQNKSFNSANDSFDCDNLFAEFKHEATVSTVTNNSDDFDDYGLDDATLLSLPATQMVSSTRLTTAKTVTASAIPITAESRPSKQTKPPKQPLKKIDSFAMEGLDDDDLLQGLEQYEKSQKSTTKRRLPWKLLDRDNADEQEPRTCAENDLDQDQDLDATQDTELLSSSA